MTSPDEEASETTAPAYAWSLRAIVLLSGAATMGLQMATVRLLAPWFGASSLVWAAIIGLALVSMGAGYLLGGSIADRSPSTRALSRSLGAAGGLLVVAPNVAPHVLPHAALGSTSTDVASIVGASVSFLAISCAPAVLLGMTPPICIRVAIRHAARSGHDVGSIYAWSTIGSIIGTPGTALVLVQWIGTSATFRTLGGLVFCAAVLAHVGRDRRVAASSTCTPGRSESRAAVTRPVLAVRLLLVVIFIEGVAMMGTEMSVARLVAPFFGASSFVWANIIAIVMGCIALGSWIGGRVADARPTALTLVSILGATGIAIAALPYGAIIVMRASTGGIDAVAVGTVAGSFIATLAMLVIPVTLLGMLPPIVLRLGITNVDEAGWLAGLVYAVSTAGALVGTFASALWLLPSIGTRRTLLIIAIALGVAALAVAASSTVRGRRRVRLVVGVGIVIGTFVLVSAPAGLIKPLDDAVVVAERESRYQYLQVVANRSDTERVLQLNEGWAVHSVWRRSSVLTDGIWDHFLVLPDLVAGPVDDDVRMLMVGNAAGTAARAFASLHPQIRFEGVELDPAVTEVGRRWFDMPAHTPVHTADARPFLRRSDEAWDIIHVDAYRQPYIPFYLATREFFALARSRLADGGIVSINVGSTPGDRRIVEAIAATMRAEFDTVVRYRAETYNELVIGLTEPGISVAQLRARIRAASTSSVTPGSAMATGDAERLQRIERAFADGLRHVAPQHGRVLRDDRAPVEWLTDSMIVGEAAAVREP